MPFAHAYACVSMRTHAYACVCVRFLKHGFTHDEKKPFFERKMGVENKKKSKNMPFMEYYSKRPFHAYTHAYACVRMRAYAYENSYAYGIPGPHHNRILGYEIASKDGEYHTCRKYN